MFKVNYCNLLLLICVGIAFGIVAVWSGVQLWVAVLVGFVVGCVLGVCRPVFDISNE